MSSQELIQNMIKSGEITIKEKIIKRSYPPAKVNAAGIRRCDYPKGLTANEYRRIYKEAWRKKNRIYVPKRKGPPLVPVSRKDFPPGRIGERQFKSAYMKAYRKVKAQ